MIKNMDNSTSIRVLLTIAALSTGIILISCSEQQPATADDVEAQVEDYLRKFPYQDTHNYALTYTKGDPAAFNTWVLGSKPGLVKAGEDSVVRMNNDTFYKMAFVVLSDGPVVLGSSAPSDERFSSFQLMDDRNANYRNVIHPAGMYTLYRGEKPEQIQGEAIEVSSDLSVVIVRVEVKDKNNAEDVEAAKSLFNGITINGPEIDTMPGLDLLSGFETAVEEEAARRMTETAGTVPLSEGIVGPGQEPGRDLSYLNHAGDYQVLLGGARACAQCLRDHLLRQQR